MGRYHGTVGPKFRLYIVHVLEHEQNFSDMLLFLGILAWIYFCTLLNAASPVAPKISLCRRIPGLNISADTPPPLPLL